MRIIPATRRPKGASTPPAGGSGHRGAAIEVETLCVEDSTGHPVLSHVSLQVAPGERIALVGASGSGKTTLALALLGHRRPGLIQRAGRVTVAGHDLAALGGRELRSLRRTTITYLPQNPAAALTPTLRVAAQLRELAPARDTTAAQIAGQLRAVGLPADPEFQRRFPHQLSGGQQQRLALARALAADPAAIVLDEPTTALDPTTADLVLSEASRRVGRRAMTLLVITHDRAVASRLASRVLVMDAGRIVDAHLTTKGAALPRVTNDAAAATAARSARDSGSRPAGAGARPVLHVDGLSARHHRDGPLVLDEVSFAVGRGECVALAGRSGRGKTTLARCLTGHHRPDSGTILLAGQPLAPDLRQRTLAQRQAIQLIPQDADGSLNPRRRVGPAIARPLRTLAGLDRAAARRRAGELLELVRLTPALAARYPGQLSGGQLQRVAIARALAAGPTVLICDEITSGLDPRTQTAIYDLLTGLRADLGLAVVMITHDTALVARYAQRTVDLDVGP